MKRTNYLILIFTLMISKCSFAQDKLSEPDEAGIDDNWQSNASLIELINTYEFKTPEFLRQAAENSDEILAQNTFCEGFLKDAEAHQKIEIIEPLITARNYSDPLFDPFKNACPNIELDAFYPVAFRTLPHDDEPTSDEYLDSIFTKYYATQNPKIYHLDLDHNGILDKDEYIFHGERYFSDEQLQEYRERHSDRAIPDSYGFANNGDDLDLYVRFDIDSCRRKSVFHSRSNYSSFFGEHRNNEAEIVRYLGEYYYLELFEFGNEVGRTLSLFRVSIEEKSQQICAF